MNQFLSVRKNCTFDDYVMKLQNLLNAEFRIDQSEYFESDDGYTSTGKYLIISSKDTETEKPR